MTKSPNYPNAKELYPFFLKQQKTYMVSIYPEYHTELLPDSILRTESPLDFVENEPHRNAINKVYICRSHFRNLHEFDNIIFYRTGGYHKSVITSVGVVEKVIQNIKDSNSFINLCRKRSVFTDKELLRHWDYSKNNRSFIVYFLFVYSFPKRLNMAKLIELGIIKDIYSAPRGFELINPEQFSIILRETKTDESIIIN